MFSIGDFARLGRVSPRMLRHYDAIGLLRPAAVDPATGYRFYRAYQLGQLNRILALKDLGITLEQLRAILDGQVNTDQLEGMLRLRQAQLRAQIAAEPTAWPASRRSWP
jgi:DNA-binding transcriptional MerR regulator